MTLAELKNKARAAAKRVEDRLTAAIGAGRELNAEEEAANTADEAELADLNAQIATAEEGSSTPSGAVQIDGAAIAVAAGDAERTRILALIDLCPTSALGEPVRAAIEGGDTAGAFAISLAQAAKTRGASMEDLKAGTVDDAQLPVAGKGAGKQPSGKKPGLADRVAALGHRGLAHLKG